MRKTTEDGIASSVLRPLEIPGAAKPGRRGAPRRTLKRPLNGASGCQEIIISTGMTASAAERKFCRQNLTTEKILMTSLEGAEDHLAAHQTKKPNAVRLTAFQPTRPTLPHEFSLYLK
jgi:hypothetical protein